MAFGVNRVVSAREVVPGRGGVHHHTFVADLVDDLGQIVGTARRRRPTSLFAAGVNRNNVFRLVATRAAVASVSKSRDVSMKWPTPRRVVFSGDTDTTSSTTLSRSPSKTGVKNSTSLDALMIAVPGSGTRTAIDAVGGRRRASKAAASAAHQQRRRRDEPTPDPLARIPHPSTPGWGRAPSTRNAGCGRRSPRCLRISARCACRPSGRVFIGAECELVADISAHTGSALSRGTRSHSSSRDVKYQPPRS